MKNKKLEKTTQKSPESIMDYHELKQLDEDKDIRVSRSFCYLTYAYYRITHKLNEELLDLFVNMIYEENSRNGENFTMNVKDAKAFFAPLPKKWQQKSVFHDESKQTKSPKQKMIVS